MTILCSINDIPEETSKGFELENHKLFAVQKDGVFYVYQNWCPHLGINLEYMPDTFLDLEKRFIECANHGALFEIETGAGISGPCVGKALRPVPFEIVDDNIVITQLPAS